MLEIQNLTLTLRESGRTLLRDFSLTLSPGDKAAVIGEEGNGKSTLLQAVARPEMVEPYCECTGTIRRNGLRIGYLTQELEPSLAQQSVADYFQDADIYQNLSLRT